MQLLRFRALIFAALLPVLMVGCGASGDGRTADLPAEVEQKNKDRGEQIRKEMEAKYKKPAGGRR